MLTFQITICSFDNSRSYPQWDDPWSIACSIFPPDPVCVGWWFSRSRLHPVGGCPGGVFIKTSGTFFFCFRFM